MAPPEAAPLKLLVDSCLTPAAIAHLGSTFGGRVDIVHVDAVLPPGATDEAVLAWAARTRRVVVTANIGDFVELARRTDGHCGLALIDDQNTKDVQIAAISRIAAAIAAWRAGNGDPAGHVFIWRRTGGGRLAVRKIP